MQRKDLAKVHDRYIFWGNNKNSYAWIPKLSYTGVNFTFSFILKTQSF